MKKLFVVICFLMIYGNPLFAQKEGDIIINEIGNSGKKSLYNGGEYVELLVLKEGGIKLAGW